MVAKNAIRERDTERERERERDLRDMSFLDVELDSEANREIL